MVENDAATAASSFTRWPTKGAVVRESLIDMEIYVALVKGFDNIARNEFRLQIWKLDSQGQYLFA
mgnify:FL=1